jgi:glutamate--cysteine ligase
MGIIVTHSPADVLSLSRKQRKKMASNKGGGKVDKVILQEGVYTFETIGEDSAVCEPVVYMIDKDVVGGFYRVHTGRGESESLNSPGMHFEPLSFAEPLTMPNHEQSPDVGSNRFYAYSVVARLALVAAAREINTVLN